MTAPMQTACPCCSNRSYEECCGPLHAGLPAGNPQALMRSRYGAYCLGLIEYLVTTTLPSQQAQLDVIAMTRWSRESTWLKLHVEDTIDNDSDQAQVTFVAHWMDPDGTQHQHRECSDFIRKTGKWYFVDPNYRPDTGRNTPCPCGSGKKYKRCCAP